jgi:hypothetical protein
MSDIEKNPSGAPLPEEAGMKYAISVAISGTMNDKNTKAFYTYLNRMPPEFNILAWQLATKRDEKLFMTKEFMDFSTKYRAVFQG